eukprot:3588589-Rhodomonas_salina.3
MVHVGSEIAFLTCTVRVLPWQRAGGKEVPPYRVLTAAAFKGGGATMVAVASTDRCVRFYDPLVHEVFCPPILARVLGKHRVVGSAMVSSITAFQLPIWDAAECHQWLVLGGADGVAHLFNAQAVVRELEVHGQPPCECVTELAFKYRVQVSSRSLVHRVRLFEPPMDRVGASKEVVQIDRSVACGGELELEHNNRGTCLGAFTSDNCSCAPSLLVLMQALGQEHTIMKHYCTCAMACRGTYASSDAVHAGTRDHGDALCRRPSLRGPRLLRWQGAGFVK